MSKRKRVHFFSPLTREERGITREKRLVESINLVEINGINSWGRGGRSSLCFFLAEKKRGKGEEEVSDEECTLAIGTQVEETGSVTIKIRRS